MKFIFFNDTGKEVIVHPASFKLGTNGDMARIKHLEERTFEIPDGSFPYVKIWDERELGLLVILVTPVVEKQNKRDDDADSV